MTNILQAVCVGCLAAAVPAAVPVHAPALRSVIIRESPQLLLSHAVHTLAPPAGMVRVSGLLPTGCKMLDTPGVPHAFQVRPPLPLPAGVQPPAPLCRLLVLVLLGIAACATTRGAMVPVWRPPRRPVSTPAAGRAPDRRRDAHGAAAPPAQAAHLPHRGGPGVLLGAACAAARGSRGPCCLALVLPSHLGMGGSLRGIP